MRPENSCSVHFSSALRGCCGQLSGGCGQELGQELPKKQIDLSKWVGQKGYPKMSHVDLENDVTHDFGFPKFSDKPKLGNDHEWPHKWDMEGLFLPPGFAHTGVDSVQQLEPIPISTKKN
jgi:hypothetical protein